MKAQELRCNNWINVFEKPTPVIGVIGDKIYFTNENGKEDWAYANSVKPIELTPGLLGKIKEFNIKLGDGIGMEIGGLVLACYNHTPNKVLLMMHDSDGDLVNAVDTEIMYLHTLQNVVYDLSGGTELSITL